MKVLIGYDGSESADAALGDLHLAGVPRDSEVLVFSVADLLMSRPRLSDVGAEIFASRRVASSVKLAQTHAEQVIGETEVFAEKAADRLRAEFPDWKVGIEVVTGSPAWELIDAADNWKVDLIFVGSHGRSAIGRFFLGSVSTKVVNDARCSVRVGRPRVRERADAPPRLVVGVDGSIAAEQAIYAVGQRVWPSGSEVRLLAVDDTTTPASIASRLPQAAEMINSYYQKRGERVAAMLEWASQQLNAIGLRTSVSTHKGDSKKVLLAQASDWRADCIFVGTRDFKSGFERFRLGSVSTAIVTGADCSVEVVRPPMEEEIKE